MANNLRVVIAAAGTGSRMKSPVNKQYMLLKEKPVLSYSLEVFEQYNAVDEIIIVAHPREIEYCEKEIVKKYGYHKVKKVIPGGEQRQDSVWAGLTELGADTDYVAVHDGARPLLTSNLLSGLLQAAQEWGAAIPGICARDTGTVWWLIPWTVPAWYLSRPPRFFAIVNFTRLISWPMRKTSAVRMMPPCLKNTSAGSKWYRVIIIISR